MSEYHLQQCCFCGTDIPADEQPRQIVLPLDDGTEQTLYGHEECLRRALHPSVPLAI